MKILGIDPGLNTTGYGLVDTVSGGLKLIEAGIIRSTSSLPLEKRLLELYSGLEEVIKEFTPDVLSVEDLYSHYKHPKTAVIMGHARGVLYLAASRAGIPVFSYSATRIKKSLTGAGHATKEQVSSMIANTFKLSGLNVPADATDAVAAALCHINTVSHGGVL